MFNPKDVAETLKKSGAFIPGIRPGEQSARYIDGVLTRLTMFGALYMTAVCLLPQFLGGGGQRAVSISWRDLVADACG